MIDWLRDRDIFLVSIFFLVVILGLTFLAGLGRWGPEGLILLSLAALASAGAYTLALLRLARVPPRNWSQQIRAREKSIAQAREQVFELTQELRRKSDQLTTGRDQAEFLRQSFGELASSLEPRRVLNGILERAIHAAQARWGSILLLDEQGRPGESFLSREAGPGQPVQHTSQILRQGFAGWVVLNRRGDIIFDTTQDPRWLSFPEDEEPARSAVAVPFLRRERVLGVMVLTHTFPFQFSEAHLALLQELAQQAAICLENADLYVAAEGERHKLAAILDGTTDAVIVVDPAERILLLNQAAERAFGIPSETALGQTLSAEVAHPALQTLLAQALDRNEAVTGELTTADERVRYCNISPIPGVGWVAIMQDITYLKELDRLKSEFVASVSHDLRSPLTAVRGYADLVPLIGPVTEDQGEALQHIAKAVTRMNELIGGLLDLAKIEAGIDMAMSPCRLEEIVTGAMDSLKDNAGLKGLLLHAEIEEGLPEVLANAGRLRQVVCNLVDNAIKYTSAGGSIRVHLGRHDQEVVFSVTDTGPGIAPQDQQQLFQKFYRVPTTATDDIPGTGLGLALVRSIVEQHRGHVWVRSALGQGSTFAFALPIAASQPEV
jgi:PAS domain S-box-containing protein